MEPNELELHNKYYDSKIHALITACGVIIWFLISIVITITILVKLYAGLNCPLIGILTLPIAFVLIFGCMASVMFIAVMFPNFLIDEYFEKRWIRAYNAKHQ